MKIMAHRGISSLAPENTLSAINKAIEFGCMGIEVDVQLSADHIPMVIHDETLNRCTRGQGQIRQLTCAQIQNFDAGIWFGDEFAGEKVPTLKEILNLIKLHNIVLNIELKIHPNDDVNALAFHVAKLIKNLNVDPQLIVFSSFDTNAIRAIYKYLPDFRRGHLWQKIPDNFHEILTKINAYSVHCDYRFLTKDRAEQIKKLGYHIFTYTANFPELVQNQWQWGVDVMISDNPHMFENYKCN